MKRFGCLQTGRNRQTVPKVMVGTCSAHRCFYIITHNQCRKLVVDLICASAQLRIKVVLETQFLSAVAWGLGGLRVMLRYSA